MKPRRGLGTLIMAALLLTIMLGVPTLLLALIAVVHAPLTGL